MGSDVHKDEASAIASVEPAQTAPVSEGEKTEADEEYAIPEAIQTEPAPQSPTAEPMNIEPEEVRSIAEESENNEKETSNE